MSAFEISVTPTRHFNKKRLESREPTDVIMAPFSAKAIVQFEDVPVTKTAKRLLKIINPSEDDIQVKVTKPINTDHNITIDWLENVVPAHSIVEMEMVWNPLYDVACKENMQLTDNRNFRKDVMVILKTLANKPAKNTRKYPTISSGVSNAHVKTLRLKSPKGSSSRNGKSSLQMQQRKRFNLQQEKPAKKTDREVDTQTKVQLQWKNSMRSSVLQQQQKTQHREKQVIISPLAERNQNVKVECVSKISPIITLTAASKENISPLTPKNVMNLIDNLKFTPLTNTQTKTTSNLDNLASLPTPASVKDTQLTLPELRPRRLTAAELTEDCNLTENLILEIKDVVAIEETKNLSALASVSNKTFEVKRSESLESLDGSFVEGRVSFGGLVLNKTTTICATPVARHLEKIEEEDAHDSSHDFDVTTNHLQKTFNKQSSAEIADSEQLKRDVKLVGTPLRKYSESMKDLSFKSPTASKISIQGSMPNLNEMQPLRSIEQNRYFYQTSTHKKSQQSDEETFARDENKCSKAITRTDSLDSKDPSTNDNSYSSQSSLLSNAEYMFNQNDILAQSSRFNLNEIGSKSRRNSPVLLNKYKNASPRQTPPKVTKKYSPNLESPDIAASKRRSRELSFSESPSTESIASSCESTKPHSNKIVSPPKRQRIEPESSQRFAPTNASAVRARNWSQTQPNKFKLAKTLSLVKKPITPKKNKNEPRIKLYDTDLFLQSYINPDPFAATTTCDPFLASTMYLDERAVDRHQNDFRKWLNALVSIPADLNADCNAKIDVGKLFNEVRNKELMLAPTKEEHSMNYLTKFRLESLRRAAVQLFLSEEMRGPCSKVAVYVSKNAIRIRSDRNLHLDVVMQRYILELLLCFNPLWLRLGLEVVYGEKIHLQSNSDVVGLSTFILNRLFRDKFLEQKYSKAYTLSEEYADHIKKFTLQKMLFLLLFLDRAKEQRIVKHNPCLFLKKSQYKETKEILLKFSSELLANIGDITRELKRLGYVLQHKQTFLDEFDYAFNNLAVDLRDGVRLTRVMEIILLREDLSKQLRVPAISRLQRVYNVNLALRALQDANFELKGSITAADIVDGHREKTLSLLWQIIYKFRSPKFHAAAKVLQEWWRKSWLGVVIQRRIRHKEEQRRIAAATKIQAYFRGFITRRFTVVFKEERMRAATVVQKYMRRHLARKQFYQTLRAIVRIQHWYRSSILSRQYREEFLLLRDNCIYLQRCIRRWIFSRKLLNAAEFIGALRQRAYVRHESALIIQRFMSSIVLHRKWQNIVEILVERERQAKLEYRSAARLQSFFKSVQLRRALQEQRKAATSIQQYWQSYRAMCCEREKFLLQRQCAIIIQQRYRAVLIMRKEKMAFKELRAAAIVLQRRFRAHQLMLREREKLLHLKYCTINVQQRLRALFAMRLQRKIYLREVAVIKKLQLRVRATQEMKQQRAAFIYMRAAACSIQRFYRAHLAMKQQLVSYQHIRQCVVRIQRKWRATLLARRINIAYITLQYYTIVVQQKYRANKQMHLQHAEYLKLRAAVVLVQRRFRDKQQMRRERATFVLKKSAALVIQHRYRAYKLMRFMRAKYHGTREAVTCLQQYIRGYLSMKRERAIFKRKQRAAIVLQRAFRARQTMLETCATYKRLRAAAICVQQRYRSKQNMLRTRHAYQRQRDLIITVQRRYRAKLYARLVRQNYQRQRALIIKLQRRFRATIAMRTTRNAYLAKRMHVICIQRRFRAHLAMQRQRCEYLKQRNAASRLQTWYRSILEQRREQHSFQRLRSSSLTIQRKWRATKAMSKQRQLYLCTVKKIIMLQRVLRATIAMREQRKCFQQQQAAAIVLQRRYRARLEMLKMRSQYQLIRSLIVCIQRKYRAHRAMLVERRNYLLLKRTTIHLQQRYRGRLEMETIRSQYLQLKSSTLSFQSHVRGYLARKRFQSLMTPEMVEFLRQKKAAKLIQRYWRGYRVRKRWRSVRITTIRKNIQLLKQSSSTLNTIRWKVQDAVRLLRGRFSASEALHVLTRLERLSRTVPHLLMGHSDFICTFCYGIMAQAIRSEVDKQLIEYCSCIILNLARYNSTTANTFQQGGLTTIAQMLLRWCNKDCEIFNTLCTLIWIFAHCPQKRKIIREFMTTPEAIYVVRETKKLVARKEKMKLNARNPGASTRGQNLSNFSSRALPSLEPDYGVLRNKPYTFISSVYAFEVVLCKLGIDVY